ncbi:MAG: hypothetical protein QS98_C0010G0075 [archaeon GW2011_AR3]|nr:MAG: hypothetical protein QS98_C0010G0075 [archaeon GW2011_AR3]MBS3110215.1 hypothetical protein [Candidatus Woesearchaeota archaeon]
MKHTWQATLLLMALFLATEAVGLVILLSYVDVDRTAETGITAFESLPFDMERPDIDESLSYLYIAAAIIIGTIILLVLIKFRRVGLWKFWFLIAIAFTLTFAIGAFVDEMIAVVIAIFLALWKIYRPNIYVHNLTEILIYGGLAAIFVPIINMFSAFMLLILISIYDIYAVWRSEHMIEMAKFQTQNRLFAGLFIPYGKKFPQDEKKPEQEEKIDEKEVGKYSIEKRRTAILGGGDLGFPLIFAGVVMKTLINGQVPVLDAFTQSFIIILFAGIGLFLLLYKSEKGKFYPAMPFISLGCFLGYALVYFL